MRPRKKSSLYLLHYCVHSTLEKVCMMSSMDQDPWATKTNITLIYYFHQFFSWKENNLTILPISEMNRIIGLQKNKDMDPSIFIKWKCFTHIYKTAYNITMCTMIKVKYIKNFIQGIMRESSFIYQSTRRKNISSKTREEKLNWIYLFYNWWCGYVKPDALAK